MKLTVVPSKRFKRQYNRLLFSGNAAVIKKLNTIIDLLVSEKNVPVNSYNHKLSGALNEYEECHVAPDWLLIYQIHKDVGVLELFATGTHSQLFD